MIYTIKYKVSIHLSDEEDDFLTKRRGIVFHPEDTLKSALNERTEMAMYSTKFNDINSKERNNLWTTAKEMKGDVHNIRFDKAKCILVGEFIKDKEKEEAEDITSISISRKVSSEYYILSQQAKRYNTACGKIEAIEKAYREKLIKMLNHLGIRHVRSLELRLALRRSDYDLYAAFEYATQNIYTPLKLIMSELWLISGQVTDLKSKRKKLDDDWTHENIKDHKCPSKSKVAFDDENVKIKTEIRLLSERHGILLTKSKQMRMEFLSKFVICGTKEVNKLKVMQNLKSKNWNMNETYKYITKHCNEFV